MDTISSPTRLPTEPYVPSPIDLVVDEAATHVAVDLTTELRWFFDGPLPKGVLSWFTRDDTAGLAESRWDSYRDDARDDVGIKRRFGATLELKLRLEAPELFAVAPPLDGCLETWRRWSPADDRVEPREHAEWVDVNKTIIKRRFDIDGHESPLTEETRAMTGEACDVEIVDITVDGHHAWSFAFAAFGPSDTHRRLIEIAWDALLDGEPTPEQLLTNPGLSCGYPEWLTSVRINATR